MANLVLCITHICVFVMFRVIESASLHFLLTDLSDSRSNTNWQCCPIFKIQYLREFTLKKFLQWLSELKSIFYLLKDWLLFCNNKIPTVAITLVLGRSSWSPMLVRVTNLVERAGKHILCHTTLWWQHSAIRCNDPDSGCLALTEDVSDVLCYCQQGGNLVPNNVPCVKGQEPYII